MLHLTSLLVDAALANIEKFAEEVFKESVLSDDLLGHSAAVVRERHAFVRFVYSVTVSAQALQHFCNARSRELETFRYLIRGGRLMLLLQAIDCLEILFDVAAAHIARI
jgi:hypothetical protein